MNYHLAQVNIAPLIAPLEDPKITEFVAQLKPINALEDKAPAFVWRLQSESGNATDINREHVRLGVGRDVARVRLQIKSHESLSRPGEMV